MRFLDIINEHDWLETKKPPSYLRVTEYTRSLGTIWHKPVESDVAYRPKKKRVKANE
jgi:hypothetical protein